MYDCECVVMSGAGFTGYLQIMPLPVADEQQEHKLEKKMPIGSGKGATSGMV